MGIIDIRIGASCHDTFEECCPLINEIDKEPKKTFIVPPIVPENIHSKCGIRNHEGVGIQIVGDLAGESQFGVVHILLFYPQSIKSVIFI